MTRSINACVCGVGEWPECSNSSLSSVVSDAACCSAGSCNSVFSSPSSGPHSMVGGTGYRISH